MSQEGGVPITYNRNVDVMLAKHLQKLLQRSELITFTGAWGNIVSRSDHISGEKAKVTVNNTLDSVVVLDSRDAVNPSAKELNNIVSSLNPIATSINKVMN
ncbi:hypothetical protein A2U01_0008521 [Trifolium medium]|uniref:Uncharacterized protein n=1 Tax=Trifolium medium TaxID=97028 RepID=A0A392MMY3_9FABA|nr:hypothetical protein [Trifolium medium]